MGTDGYRHFSRDEFQCSHTGKNEIDGLFIRKLDHLRDACGFPFIITSGYRHPTHPKEAVKDAPGMHTRGIAADIRVADGKQRRALVEAAMAMNFRGIGVAKTFVHVDLRQSVPVLWTY